MIVLKESGFWNRWFRWSYAVNQNFWHHNEYPRIPERTDFCTLTRNIFLTAPLALAINLVVACAALGALYNFGRLALKHLSAVGIILALLLGFALLVVAVVVFCIGTKRIVHSETAQIAKAYLLAKKNRFCSAVEIKP